MTNGTAGAKCDYVLRSALRCVARQTAGRVTLIVAALAGGAANAWPQGVQPGLIAPPNPPGIYLPPAAAPVQMAGGTGGAFVINQTAAGGELVGPVLVATGKVGYERKTGLQLRVATRWPGQYGYRTLGVAYRSRRPATRDMRVTFEFHAGWYSNRGRSIAAVQNLTLAAGESTVEATLLVPQYADWQTCGWRTTVDGQVIDDLSVDYVSYLASNNTSGGVAAVVAPPALASGRLGITLQVLSGAMGAVQGVALGELPDDWMHYTTIDLVALPAAELPRLAREHPTRADALLRWVRAGGNLWLVEAGPRDFSAPSPAWQPADEVDRVLDGGEPLGAGVTPAVAPTLGAARWRSVPLGERAQQPVEAALAVTRFLTDATATAATPESTAPRPRPGVVDMGVEPPAQASPTAQAEIKVRPHGLGLVAAFYRDMPVQNLEGESPLMEVIRQSLIGSRAVPTTRYGNGGPGAQAEFNNWLIPGVGTAPVVLFQLLISVFVLAIGPLNYWWLKRRKVLPALVVIAPVAASAVTATLLGYGILSDGLGVRARVRSLTLLDQRSGEAVSWSRLSYYAGASPNEGLRMPRDVAVLPIVPEWAAGYGFSSANARNERQIVWNDQQQLARGWLPSRTPTQYLAIAARPSQRRLELQPTARGLRATNRLGARVVMAAIQDHEGRTFWCENLDVDARAALEPTSRRDFAPKFRKAFADGFPTFPPGADQPYSGNYYGYLLSQNLMETRLEAINSPIVQSWGNGSYIALTERGVETSLGLEEVLEESSFHLIEGTW